MNRLISVVILTGLAAAQSPPPQDSGKAGASGGETALSKALETVKNLEERVALLEQELLEVRLQSKAGPPAGSEGPPAAGGARRPQIEEEEPFDAGKMKASDDAEVEAVAKAVAVLLPANVRQLSNPEQPRAGSPAPVVEDGPGASAPGRAAASQMTVQAGGPKPTRRVEPVIPASMRSSIAGEVTVSVKVYVGANGEVIGTVPVRQGDPTADQICVLAAEAVTRWRFEPVVQNGQPMASQTMVRFRFAK